MAENQIALITKYSPKYWDLVYKQESRSSLLDSDNPATVQWIDAKTVKIAKFQTGGLDDYHRNNIGDDRVNVDDEGNPIVAGLPEEYIAANGIGYKKSNVGLFWETFTVKCDRAAAYPIEYFDNEESGGQLVGLGVTEISRTTIIPEVDAYCFSTIASYCNASRGNKVVENFKTAGAKPVEALNKALQYFDEHEVPNENRLIFVSPAFLTALRNTTEVQKPLLQKDFNANVKFTITDYEGNKLITVAPNRFRTNISIFGRQGFGWKSTSEEINFLAVSKEAVIHVVKYDKVKVLGGDINLAGNGFDGYTVYARVYHDVFVPDNKVFGLYLSVNGAAGGDSTKAAKGIDLAITFNAANKVTAIDTYPTDVLVYKIAKLDSGDSNYNTDKDKGINDKLSVSGAAAATVVKVGDTIAKAAGGTDIFAIAEDRTILAKVNVQKNG